MIGNAEVNGHSKRHVHRSKWRAHFSSTHVLQTPFTVDHMRLVL